MSEKYFVIEIGTYGLMIDTALCYMSISWLLLGLSALAIVTYKIIKRKRG
jgi:hypothetical protein